MSASIIASVITGGTNSHQTVAEDLNAYATDFVNQGVWGTIVLGAGSTAGTGSFAPSQDSSPDLGVSFASGVAYVNCTPSGQDAQVLRARMTSSYTEYTINSNSSGSTKYDWIYLQANATNASTPDSAADNVINLYTSRSSSNASDNGSPPTYGILLCVVTVANGASTISNSNISDRRTQASLSSVNSGGSTGWSSLGYALSYSANNGNKEFQVTSPNNLTGLLSPGMKIQVARSVTPPTQSMAFASASSQYATLASPSGITFTSAFTCEAWVYLQSYTGQVQSIIGRSDSALNNGFNLQVNANGQISVVYASSSSSTYLTSYQGVPLNQWVHIAGVITSVSSKTGIIYINGTAVPSSLTASNATTLTQSSNLSVGAVNTGASNTFFNGYISEARVWSVAQTQASIQANMAISISGSASNLVAYFQGNGNFTDGTSNANNLTATNGAIATQAANPYNAIEYAVINTISYSNPTTTITLDTGTQCTIPNQTLNNPYYSINEDPYGIAPGLSKNRTLAYIPICANLTATTLAYANIGALVTIPVGRRVKVSVYSPIVSDSASTQYSYYVYTATTVGTLTTNILSADFSAGSVGVPAKAETELNTAGGSLAFSLAMASTTGTITFGAGITAPGFFKVELVS